ncbi:MAG: DUF1697 domain-containing protein [Propionibacteriaceae bacterium]|nr:DUF1697 domain-containing protein [Propionibacteriaceae bacterium]
MTRQVAFMRGINVGGKNKISMPGLRAMAEGLGYSDVATYINSGNLLFTSAKRASTLATEISSSIEREFGFSIDVTVRSQAQLNTILAENPYPDGDPSQVTVAFLTKAPPAVAEEKVAALASEHEPFTFAGNEVYVNYTQGLGNSALAQQFSKAVGVSATVRNIRTVSKIADMLAENPKK